MSRIPTIQHANFYPEMKSFYITCLDKDGLLISRATAFGIKESDGYYLYTCWHVITGVDPRQIPPIYSITRKSIRIHAREYTERAPGVAAIGGEQAHDFDLYDPHGAPKWQQEINHDNEPGNIVIPKLYDVVRLRIKSFPGIDHMFYIEEDISMDMASIGEDVYIAGFPFGFSESNDGPAPIFLKRSIASLSYEGHRTLIDGAGVIGMSGSPVLIRRDSKWSIIGIYGGDVYPEHKYYSDRIGEQFGSKLPLGYFFNLYAARSFMGIKYRRWSKN